jgi:hypothetical protein
MRTLKIPAILSTATLLLLACSSADPNPAPVEVGNTVAEDRAPDPQDGDIAPTGRGHYVRDTSLTAAKVSRPKRGGNGISYHGGPLITSGPNVHFIWYGSWSSGDKAILENLARSLGGSPYFNINTTYYNGSGTHVANSVSLAGEANDNYSRGKSLSDADIVTIVSAQNPTDTSGFYAVMTAADVNETSGFCTQYCGWHDHATIGGLDIKYAFIGNPARCPSACTNGTGAPNGSVGADGAASIFSHELEEATTDPDLNAWFDTTGEENADKCAWTFGATYTTANGATANMNLGGKDYLIQQNWVNASGGFCAKSF